MKNIQFKIKEFLECKKLNKAFMKIKEYQRWKLVICQIQI